MHRLARLDAPDVLHHIIIRGIERRKIFRDNKDKNNFIDRLSDLLPATQTACYAWAFIPNHAHFLLKSKPLPLVVEQKKGSTNILSMTSIIYLPGRCETNRRYI